jgi:hypothetical protein
MGFENYPITNYPITNLSNLPVVLLQTLQVAHYLPSLLLRQPGP